MSKIVVSFFCFFTFLVFADAQLKHDFRNQDLSIETRANDLLSKLTLEEKISLLGFESPAIERLCIPSYNWWNEGLHGVARAGQATVFPQAIALASTFDEELAYKVADAISTEARAKHNIAIANDNRVQYLGINFWTPNINIFRDPRWGRGQETYGEDPFLTSKIGVSFVEGLQGKDKNKYKIAASAKHFAVHSGPEATRHEFNAIVDEKDLRETYLYAFKALIDKGVSGVMCGYNRLNDEPCCISDNLLNRILRNEWNFDGQITTDCWALEDIWLRHKVIPTSQEVVAAAIKAGVNMDCSPFVQRDALEAIEMGLINASDIDKCIYNTIKTQLKLGIYDDPCDSPYGSYGLDSISNQYHINLALKVAEKSMVLVKNNGILPLNKDSVASMMVAGEHAANISVLAGNYHGLSGNMVTFAEGIADKAGPGIGVQYDLGCSYIDTVNFGGTWAASSCDVTVLVLGLSPLLEGEHGDAFLSNNGGDKIDLKIPEAHIAYLKKMRKTHNHPIIVVLTSGSAIDVKEVEKYADAVILSWYAGEQGGKALANIIFGDTSPSGRLPLTFYNNIEDLPSYDDYKMLHRTYRYFNDELAYPFGYGLSYSSFEYNWIKMPSKKYKEGSKISFGIEVTNTGDYDSDEVVQVYIEYPEIERMPIRELKAFKRIHVEKNNKESISLEVDINDLKKWDLETNQWHLYKGKYKLLVSKSSNDHLLEHQFIVH